MIALADLVKSDLSLLVYADGKPVFESKASETAQRRKCQLFEMMMTAANRQEKTMNPVRLLTIGALVTVVIMFGCGKAEKPKPTGCAQYLPEQFTASDPVRSSEVSVYKGDSLFEHINGGTELYHQYGFTEVATAYYTWGENKIMVDVYRFDNPDNAYGLFSNLRPDQPQNADFGTDGFRSETGIDFVKGQHLVRVIGNEQSDEVKVGCNALARAIETMLPGATSRPARFADFPIQGILSYSEKIHAESFLGHDFLHNAYTRKYRVDGDTLTLFLMVDSSGEMYHQWGQELSAAAPGPSPADGLSFDGGTGMLFSHTYHGDIVFGTKGHMLAGVINYNANQHEFIENWLQTLVD